MFREPKFTKFCNLVPDTFTLFPSAPAAFETFAATFDGTNDYLTVTPSITNSKTGHIQGYWHTKNDGVLHVIMANDNSGNDGLRLYRDANNKLNLLLKNAAGTTILHIQSLSNGHIDAQGGNFFSVNWDLAAGVYELLWNGFDDAVEVVAPVNDTVDLGGNWSIGADPDGTDKFTGDLGELFAIFGQTYAALLTDANWAKFITDADLRPVDLGSDGSTPYGVQPEFYWKADVAGTITENLGSEGNFTENGTLVAASVTPDTFIWRMPLTDFPDTGSEALGETPGNDTLAANGKTATAVYHVEADTGNFGYIAGPSRHRVTMEAEATAIGDVRFILENTIAQTEVDLRLDNHFQLGVKYQIVFTFNVNNVNDFEFWVNGVDETANVTITEFTDATLDFTFNRYRFAQWVTATRFDGGIGGAMWNGIDQTGLDINDYWDSVNSVPKWPGRLGGNWGGMESINILPGSGFRRKRGGAQDADLSEDGTSQPLSPRASWFV